MTELTFHSEVISLEGVARWEVPVGKGHVALPGAQG
jgi:hypothetical protein